jgi:hypothetical protein
MAPELGQRLREARIERGIELSEAERATKIRTKFLRAMEEDRWEALPAPAYARGFLSTYARFLGLDDAALVDQLRRTAGEPHPSDQIPSKVLRPGVVKRRRSVNPRALLAGVLASAAAVALGLAIVGAVGGSDEDGDVPSRDREAETGAGATTETMQASEVSLELRTTGIVWVCLVDDRDRALVNGETLTSAERRGPFDGSAFEVTLGNGSVELTVDGRPAEVPPVAEPLGYRITPSGVRELAPSLRPDCV